MTGHPTREYLGRLLLALIIGALAGVGAMIFRALIAFGQDLLWPTGNTFVEQLQHADPWLIILVPAAMGLVAGPITSFWAREVRGPGVPEVMEALALREGRIRHRVTLIKSIITAGLISAGGSLGREGPIVQIGSSIGSSLSQLFQIGPDARRLAVACGAAAGIAATFQAPMAGTLFAVEVLLFDLEVTSLSNIIIAAVTGTMTARALLGEAHVFIVPSFSLGRPLELFLYCGLGICAGFVSLLLMGVIFNLPKLWNKARLAEWLTPACGGLLVGMIGLFLPHALGVGYESIDIALAGGVTFIFALILLGGKIVTTGISIGSGMSGGIFAPSLFIGAMLGTFIGEGAMFLWPDMGIVPAHYALIGMGAMVSGTTLAPITAILTIFEFTYTYEVILPLMVSCIASLMVVRLLHGYSIYETKLIHKGINIVRGREVNILRGMRVKDHMTRDLQILRSDTPCGEIALQMEQSPFPHFVVLDDRNRLQGVLTLRDFRRIIAHPELCQPQTKADSLMVRDVIWITEDNSMEKAFHLFAGHNFSFLPVVSAADRCTVIGQLKKTDLLTAYDQYVFKEHILSPLGWVCPLPTNKRPPKDTDSKRT